jgi:hypothetical protein
MKMVGRRTEAIYRRYAIADEKSMKEAAGNSINSTLSTSNPQKLQSNFKVSGFYRTRSRAQRL